MSALHSARLPLLLMSPMALSAALAAEPSIGLEEIVVTARRVQENLQTTPVSVTAVTADMLDRRGIDNIRDLGNKIANLSMITGQGGGSQNQISIRGVGQSDFILTSDQSVGLYMDGVYVSRSLGAALDLVDIERLEVLRGPQGTLFGRNTTAGAVQVVSALPSDTVSGAVEAATGRFDRADIKGSINLPLVEGKLRSRFSAASLNQDGPGRRLFDGTDGADHEILAGRASVQAIISEKIDAVVTVDGTRKRGNGGLERLVTIDPNDPNLAFYNSFLILQGLPPADGRFITDDPNDSFAGSRNVDDYDIFGISGTLNWDLGSVALKSITAYRDMEVASGYDFDATPYPLAEQELNLDQRQFSQELQASGRLANDRLKWIAGFYYFHEKASDTQVVPFYQPVVATPDGGFMRVPGGFTFTSFISQTTRSYAGYGQATYSLTDRLSLTAGVRYTKEKKKLLSWISGFFVRPPGTVRESWSDVSPRFGLEYQVSDEVFAYVSASRGYRSGGFNGRNTTPLPPQSYEPETIWAYEFGLKSELFDRRVRANGAVFYYDYRDFQGLTLDSFQGIVIKTGNIAKVAIAGAEFELEARPVEPLQLSASIGYTHHDIKKVEPGAEITIRPDTRLVNAPKWTATLAASYTAPSIAGWTPSLHADVNWKSSVEFFLPNFPDEGQDGYAVANGHISVLSPDESFAVQAFVNNIGNKHYRLFAENGTPLGVPATTAVFAPPREWGVRLKYRF